MLLVMAYHCEYVIAGSRTRILTGGWIGVDIFFVLSGYLITAGLLGQARGAARARLLPAFYARRLRRLGPAAGLLLATWMVLSLTGVVPVVQLGDHPHPGSDWLALAPVIGLVTLGYNWWLAYDMPSPVGMGHLWSLTIEEQFYLVWPGLMLFVLRRRQAGPRYLLRWCAIAAGIAFSLALLASQTGRRYIAYFGTPTRMLGLVLGAAVALERPTLDDVVHSGRRAASRGRLLAYAGCVLLGGLAIAIPDTSRALVPLASVAAAAGTTAVVRYIVIGDHVASTSLPSRCLRWCGARSYALYLWDAPAVFVCEQIFGVGVLAAVFSTAATFACAVISWRLVERRFMSRARRGNAVPGAGADAEPTLGEHAVAFAGPVGGEPLGPQPWRRAPG